MGGGHAIEDVRFEFPDGGAGREAGGVDQDVDAAEAVDCSANDASGPLEIADGFDARERASTHRLDLAHHSLGSGCIASDAGGGGADVVDHDTRAVPREFDGGGASDAPCCAGNDRGPAREGKAQAPNSRAA